MAKKFTKDTGNELTRLIINSIDGMEIASLKTIEAFHKRRIFNASQATDGSSLGTYKSRNWVNKRIKAGRQVGKKDLQFSGDTKNNMQVGRSGINNVYQFTTDLARIIMRGQSNKNQVGKEVAEVSEEEIELGLDEYNTQADRLLRSF